MYGNGLIRRCHVSYGPQKKRKNSVDSCFIQSLSFLISHQLEFRIQNIWNRFIFFTWINYTFICYTLYYYSHSIDWGARYQRLFESTTKTVHTNWRNRFCRSETITWAFNACYLSNMVSVTILLSIIQNYRAVASNL